MQVLQFAFGAEPGQPLSAAQLTSANCVVYTGTHDNDTTRGWYATATEPSATIVRRYLATDGGDVAWDLIRAAWAGSCPPPPSRRCRTCSGWATRRA